MREIKFRAWVPEKYSEKTMIYSDYRGNHDCYFGFDAYGLMEITEYIANEEGECCIPWVRSDAIIMQSTGLKDKNGVEIYEGDIYRIKGFHVIMQDKYPTGPVPIEIPFDYVAVVKMDNPYSPIFAIGEGSPDIEVIGNVFENPNLLEQNK